MTLSEKTIAYRIAKLQKEIGACRAVHTVYLELICSLCQRGALRAKAIGVA